MKQKSVSSLKKKLWSLVSSYIRERDGLRCMACGRMTSGGREIHAGHLIARSMCGVYLYFHPLNIFATCAVCNLFAGGNGALLGRSVNKKYKRDIVGDLLALREKTKHKQWDRKELEALIECLENGGNYETEYEKIVGERKIRKSSP